MADNTLQTGAANIATDDVGGVHYQVIKIAHGPADAAPVHASTANPFPVTAAAITDGTQKTKITNGSVDAGLEPFGALQVNNGFTTLFYDTWSISPIDTVDKWTVTGTAPTISGGNMQMVATASTYNAIRTKDAVIPNAGFSLVRNGISLETATATGAGRLWGLGTPATTPLPMVLGQDGAFFELDQTTGDLLAVTYAAGVRTTIATLTRPTDGFTHAYGVYVRVTQAYWILDGAIVAAKAFPNLTVVELPALIVRQNGAAFTGTPVFTNVAHLTADTSRQGMSISDPVIGTRMARVSPRGEMNVLQPEQRAATLHVTATAAVNTGSTVTLPAPAAGLFHYITSIKLVKLYSVLGVAAGAGVVVTSTNLPGAPAWLTPQAAGAVGTVVDAIDYQPTTPLRSAAAATATTFVAPAQLQTIWRWNVSYFTAA